MNITPEPLKWFDLVMACGLADVRAVSLEDLITRTATNNGIIPVGLPSVRDVARGLMPRFAQVFGREVVELQTVDGETDEEVRTLREIVDRAEEDARKENEQAGGWPSEPDLSGR
jgi:lipoyl(octanoyl) transferase